MLAAVATAWASAATDPFTWLINVGVAGVVIVLLVTGQLRTKAEVSQLERQIEAKDALIEAFQAQLTANTLPALERSAQVFEALPRATERAVYRDLGQVRAEIEELSQRLQAMTEEP